MKKTNKRRLVSANWSLIPKIALKRNYKHYLLLLVSPALLLISYPAFSLSGADIGTSDLNEQINNIRINNGTAGETRDEADRLFRLGEAQQQQGNLERAIAVWLQALEIYHRIGDLPAIGQTYDLLGFAYADLGRYVEAEDAFRRRLAIARGDKDRQSQIFTLNNLGTIILQRRNLTEATATFEEALNIARDVKNSAGEGISLSNLGLVATRLKDYNQAIKLFESALVLLSRGKDPIAEAKTFNNLGDAYHALGKYKESIRAYGAALRIAELNRDRQNQYRAIDSLVAAHTAKHRFDQVLELLQQRLAIAKSTENLHQQLRSLHLLAEFYSRQGQVAEALMAYHQAIAINRILHDP